MRVNETLNDLAAYLIELSDEIHRMRIEATILDESIAVQLDPFIAMITPPWCGEGRWNYDRIESGYVHLQHSCWGAHINLTTRIKLIDLLQMTEKADIS